MTIVPFYPIAKVALSPSLLWKKNKEFGSWGWREPGKPGSLSFFRLNGGCLAGLIS